MTVRGTDLTKLRVLVVDDERLARDFLLRMLARMTNIQACNSACDVIEASAKVRQQRFDVIFLDINMPGGSGFELFSNIPVDDVPVVVFTTAYPEYAAKAFDIQACDYLLKPFDEQRLAMALDRAEQAVKGNQRSTKAEKKITLALGERFVRLAAHEVDWMIAEGNYVRIHAGKERLYVRSSLGKLQSEFQSRSLLRIHRSCVVNIHRIREVRRKDNRHYLLILKDGATINCSRRCSRHLRSALVTNVAR